MFEIVFEKGKLCEYRFQIDMLQESFKNLCKTIDRW